MLSVTICSSREEEKGFKEGKSSNKRVPVSNSARRLHPLFLLDAMQAVRSKTMELF